jgi:hypothetical protein
MHFLLLLTSLILPSITQFALGFKGCSGREKGANVSIMCSVAGSRLARPCFNTPTRNKYTA